MMAFSGQIAALSCLIPAMFSVNGLFGVSALESTTLIQYNGGKLKSLAFRQPAPKLRPVPEYIVSAGWPDGSTLTAMATRPVVPDTRRGGPIEGTLPQLSYRLARAGIHFLIAGQQRTWSESLLTRNRPATEARNQCEPGGQKSSQGCDYELASLASFGNAAGSDGREGLAEVRDAGCADFDGVVGRFCESSFAEDRTPQTLGSAGQRGKAEEVFLLERRAAQTCAKKPGATRAQEVSF